MRSKFGRAFLGGFVGTILITLMMYFVAPMMGQRMDIAAMLGSMMGDNWALGMAAHFMLGSIAFPVFYVQILGSHLPGKPWQRGVQWGLILWLVAQIVVMPLMGGGLFSSNMGGMMAVIGSLMGHLVYGAAFGTIAGDSNSVEDKS